MGIERAAAQFRPLLAAPEAGISCRDVAVVVGCSLARAKWGDFQGVERVGFDRCQLFELLPRLVRTALLCRPR